MEDDGTRNSTVCGSDEALGKPLGVVVTGQSEQSRFVRILCGDYVVEGDLLIMRVDGGGGEGVQLHVPEQPKLQQQLDKVTNQLTSLGLRRSDQAERLQYLTDIWPAIVSLNTFVEPLGLVAWYTWDIFLNSKCQILENLTVIFKVGHLVIALVLFPA